MKNYLRLSNNLIIENDFIFLNVLELREIVFKIILKTILYAKI